MFSTIIIFSIAIFLIFEDYFLTRIWGKPFKNIIIKYILTLFWMQHEASPVN